MHAQSTFLISPAIGTRRELVSFHFGPREAEGTRQKIYIQAALHADETPAMLVGVMLRRRLEEMEAAGELDAQIVVVPVANPVGLNQHVLGQFIGRYDLASGRNFNRNFPAFDKLADQLDGRLGADAKQNVAIVRTWMREALARHDPRTEFESLQHALLSLSLDADVVIDLHCSLEATLHLYTSDAAWPQFEPLARYLGARASLIATESGGQSFDEAHSLPWWRLQKRAGCAASLLPGTIAATIECRGQRDVTYETAARDAEAIIEFLRSRGALRGNARPLPPLVHEPTPLAGSEEFHAPASGILIHHAAPGDHIRAGAPLFDIVDPLTNKTITVRSNTSGIFYMRRGIRFVTAGVPLGRVTGTRAFRTGMLLNA
ncbi:succinylglutamate desuccinylase [Burkholderia stagnalis]|uniref:succinylglutamate desuccinylase/aspartoacylase family protein n=1 Tax=Burkholderia stagnalis TaxID=1503054 RepID=UPI00075AA4B9|nr:succinylglutamate desuccinylase/aspartoacylase family protein [Burkholderia stagnalis]AOK55045.1 succinylglutamate desuccinylase [Burkholderia stagnalis]KVN80135.1 succinylglutamate desuccinylase [Burkholderia stagnalis]KWO27435.1 succinylglutamate desuccinylase [Burkholderia stagnalis]KWO43213.1 succinylglutamate desuccinylase [Burkholderia stagnalis]